MSTMMRGNLLHYMECPGTVNLNAETYLTLLTEVGTYVMKHEFRQLISSNGHGGNIAPLQLEIHCTSQNPTLCVSTTYRDSIRKEVQAFRESLSGSASHAGEFETLALLWRHPQSVNTESMEKKLPKMGEAMIGATVRRSPSSSCQSGNKRSDPVRQVICEGWGKDTIDV